MKKKNLVTPINTGSRSSNTLLKLNLTKRKHSPSISPSPVPKKSNNELSTPTNRSIKESTIKSANITPKRDQSLIDLSYSPLGEKDALSINNSDNSIHMNNTPAPSSNINVTCRFRPLNDKEKKLTNDLCVEFNSENCILIKSTAENNTYNFSFDKVFDCDAKQEEIYQYAGKPIVDCIFEGFNGTIFAYGQTSSGKTFTMQGVLGDDIYEGIIPRINKQVFEKIENKKDNKIEFYVVVSMIEIYMEKIKDLLKPNNNNLNIREDKTKGIYIEDLSEEKVKSIDEVFELMKIGNDNRSIGKTNMNEHSSRSHSIFIMQVIQKNIIDLSVKSGKLYLVDLAGSEKISKTGVSGQLLEEAKTINKSLTSLGMVINALTDGKSGHIPYRESKLTRILQDSLGGNSKTSLIITCSPSNFNEAETLSTIRFGIRAKKIKNKPKINKNVTLTELKSEIVKLEKLLELSKQRVSYLEEYITHNNIRTINTEERNNELLASNLVSKNSQDHDLYEKIENLTTQVQIEKDIQKQMKKENIQLSINLNEITERYNFIEEQHYILITEYDHILDKEKELNNLNEENGKKIEELKNTNTKKDKIIEDLIEKNSSLEEQIAKRGLIEVQQKQEETSFIGVSKNNSILLNVNDNKSIIFNDTFCMNNNRPPAQTDKTIILTEQEFFKKLFLLAEKNNELKALFDSYPSLSNKSLIDNIQENMLSDRKCSITNEVLKDNSFITNVQLNDSLRTTAVKMNNESEITRFYAKSFISKPEIDREKIMREIKSSVDSKLKKMKNFRNNRKEEDSKVFESWNLNNFKTRFKFYKNSNENQPKNNI